ncbi:hypothetical protein [Zunongwangia endophytica]|uniref:hypothetical protein n=1 Tax=Zunongwangia endophytica TaxID=1808945 RepID=UPI0025B44032|nr:hypothetical protein [Zunongwangia endophytica]MDN3596038.1 hypothetical protein [Zunongwangia endophytica]
MLKQYAGRTVVHKQLSKKINPKMIKIDILKTNSTHQDEMLKQVQHDGNAGL